MIHDEKEKNIKFQKTHNDEKKFKIIKNHSLSYNSQND